jgi:glycosyltransferase involved in cell wall biosynthesis
MFPLYKDRNTVKLMITKSLNVLKKLKIKNEIIIIDDGCPQNSGKLAKEIAEKFTNIKVFFHRKNLGYGAAIKTGLKKCKNQWIFFTDGDDENDVNNLFRLLKARKDHDLVISYRYKKKYSTRRIAISWIYNKIVRLLFNIRFRDISNASRLVSRKLIQNIKLKSNSSFIGPELVVEAELTGYKVGEIGVIHFSSGRAGSIISFKNILLTFKDMFLVFLRTFNKRFF